MDMPDWRASLCLTQHQAAEALGVSRALIAMIETGRRRLDRRTEYAMRWLAHQRAQDAPPSPPSVDERLTALCDRLARLDMQVDEQGDRIDALRLDLDERQAPAADPDALTPDECLALRKLLHRVATLEARPPAPPIAAKRAPTPEDEDEEFARAKKAALARMRQDFS